MLTGQPPFVDDDPGVVLHALREYKIRKPSRLAPVPPDLEAICLRCLPMAPEERYPSARALADGLARFLDHRPVSARPLNAAQRTTRWARREPVLAGAIALTFVVLLAGLVASTLLWRYAEHDAGAAHASTLPL